MLDDMFEVAENLKEKIEKIAKESIWETARKKGNNASSYDFAENLKKCLDNFFNTLKEGASKRLKIIEEMGGMGAIFRMAWNVEEEETPLLKFEDVVRFAKTNFNPQKHSAACLTKLKKENEYHLVFLDKNQVPMLDGSEKHKIFYAKALDDSLKAQLQEKDMLVLK